MKHNRSAECESCSQRHAFPSTTRMYRIKMYSERYERIITCLVCEDCYIEITTGELI